jgi:hypothetical protein
MPRHSFPTRRSSDLDINDNSEIVIEVDESNVIPNTLAEINHAGKVMVTWPLRLPHEDIFSISPFLEYHTILLLTFFHNVIQFCARCFSSGFCLKVYDTGWNLASSYLIIPTHASHTLTPDILLCWYPSFWVLHLVVSAHILKYYLNVL